MTDADLFDETYAKLTVQFPQGFAALPDTPLLARLFFKEGMEVEKRRMALRRRPAREWFRVDNAQETYYECYEEQQLELRTDTQAKAEAWAASGRST